MAQAPREVGFGVGLAMVLGVTYWKYVIFRSIGGEVGFHPPPHLEGGPAVEAQRRDPLLQRAVGGARRMAAGELAQHQLEAGRLPRVALRAGRRDVVSDHGLDGAPATERAREVRPQLECHDLRQMLVARDRRDLLGGEPAEPDTILVSQDAVLPGGRDRLPLARPADNVLDPDQGAGNILG